MIRPEARRKHQKENDGRQRYPWGTSSAESIVTHKQHSDCHPYAKASIPIQRTKPDVTVDVEESSFEKHTKKP
jgi:hypothetical protein